MGAMIGDIAGAREMRSSMLLFGDHRSGQSGNRHISFWAGLWPGNHESAKSKNPTRSEKGKKS